jgi:hypothetical protein
MGIHFPRYSTPDATPEAEILQSVLQDALTAAAKVHLIETSRNNPGYVRMNQTEILKSVTKRNSLQHLYNLNHTQNNKQRLRRHQAQHKNLVKKSKRDWTMVRVAKINGCGGSYIGHYWKAAKDLVSGCSQKRKIVKLSFRDPLTNIECVTEKIMEGC